MAHSLNCTRSRVIATMDRAAFEKRYPNYCRECGASGEVHWEENQSPIGSGYVWMEHLVDICPHCIGEGKCPLCGGVDTLVQEEGDEFLEYCTADGCMFDATDIHRPVLPIEPECTCWYLEYEKVEVW